MGIDHRWRIYAASSQAGKRRLHFASENAEKVRAEFLRQARLKKTGWVNLLTPTGNEVGMYILPDSSPND